MSIRKPRILGWPVEFAVTLNGDYVGYTLLNRYAADINFLPLAHHRSRAARLGLIDRVVSIPDQNVLRCRANESLDPSNAHEECCGQ